MGRPLIQATLVLLVTLALGNISKGRANDAEQIEITKQSNDIQASSMENTELRVARDTRRKSYARKNGKNQAKKKGEKKKLKKIKNKKMGQNRKNVLKLKKKGRKNQKQLRKTKKKRTKKEKKLSTNKGKKDSRLNKKKLTKQNKKVLRKSRRKSVQQKIKKKEFSKGKPKQACDEKVLCQKIKDYIKISNQLRKVRRIVKSCDTMDKKANKSAAEFDATVAALETAIGSSSGRRMMYRSRWRRAVESNDDITSIKDKLKNCSVTAKAKCQKSSVAPCQEEANLTKCETELHGWLTKFGPSKGSCLQASSDCCACITAIPDVSSDCLKFDEKSTLAVASKKKCTSGDEQGSFGFCKKLQVEAAEKGPKHAKANCPNSGIVTTTKGPPSDAECDDISCTSNAKCYKQGCGACDLEEQKCTFQATGIEGCCDRKQKGNEFYYLVGFETSNCGSGCLYTTDVANEDKICLDGTDYTCNITALEGFESTQKQLSRKTSGFTCYGSLTGGRYTCHTNWYDIHVVQDFSKFNMQCFTVTSHHYTFNGFKLFCNLDIKTKIRKCRYYYWCYSTVRQVVMTLDKTNKTQFQPQSQSVELFTDQNVTCIGAISSIFGLQMQYDNNANMWYNIPCSTPPNAPVCKQLETSSKSTNNFFFPELKFQTVQCPTLDKDNYPNLQNFQLMKTDDDMLHYEYNCCFF